MSLTLHDDPCIPGATPLTEDTARDHADRHNTNVHRDDPLEARS